MARKISGPDTLDRIDRDIAQMRRRVGDAIETAENIEARETEVKAEQVRLYRELADIRMDVLDDMEAPKRLDTAHRKALELLDAHDSYLEEKEQALAAADAAISELEDKRTRLAKEHLEAVEAYEERVAETEATLAEDEAYKALVVAVEQTAAVAARAHQKLEVARTDMEEKGEAFRGDPLFMYLWDRRYRSPDYKAGPITRMLDGWVAKLCHYDKSYLNYQRLTDLPKWLEDHAEGQDKKAADALEVLEAVEIAALEKAGAPDLQKRADGLLEQVRETDRDIDRAEIRHSDLAKEHVAALKDQVGPAFEARGLLIEGLKETSFQSLRTLAAETVDLTDDRIVDRLVKLRAEAMSLELEHERLSTAPDRLRRDLNELEGLRRQFKRARYDSNYAVFPTATLNDVLQSLNAGRMNGEQAFRRLARSVRRIQPRTEPGFGGLPRSQTIGLPGILGDVLWEVAKQSTRGSRGGVNIGFPTSQPTRRRSPRINIPRGGGIGGGRSGGGGKSGGFRTGGGF